MEKESSGKSGLKTWKVTIGNKIYPEKIEFLLADALRDILGKSLPEVTYGLIERIDVSEKETIVFVTGDETAVKVFSKVLKEYSPGVKIALSAVSPEDIRRFE